MANIRGVHNMSAPIELETETFGEGDLQNFPGAAESVRPTEGLLEVCVNFDNFNRQLFTKHEQNNFSDAYDTRTDPRGLCLVINNKEFKKHDDRHGTDIDCTNLCSLFNQLGYEVKVLYNQTADQMKSECQNFILDPRHANYSSCVLVILSHGTMGKILGTDSKPIDEKADILDYFNNSTCKLTGKPKLVIVQACRTQLGTKNQESQHEDMDGTTSERVQYVDLVDRIRRHNYKDAVFLDNSLTPDFADLLIAHSTLPGYVSWRHRECGSWFVQAIVEIFSRKFGDEHVADMLVQVNQLISDAFGQNENSQMPCPINHLRKKFYFFPQWQ